MLRDSLTEEAFTYAAVILFTVAVIVWMWPAPEPEPVTPPATMAPGEPAVPEPGVMWW